MTGWMLACAIFFVLESFGGFVLVFFSHYNACTWFLLLIFIFYFFPLLLTFQLWQMLTKKQIILFAELKAEASIMDQLSSSDSSSDSKSSSSSSSSSENSSSDSEDEETKPSLPISMPYLQPQPTVSAMPQQAVPDKDASHNRSQESSGHMMNTLRKYKGCSFLSAQFQTSRFWKETILFLSMSLL